MQVYWLEIMDVIDETDEIKTYKLEVPDGFTWEEGAYTHLALEGYKVGDQVNRDLIRHMSICTLPHENVIGITTRIREKCSTYKQILRNMKVGEKVALFKTRSNVPLKRENKNVYLLSSGVGLATFRPLVLKYVERPDGINKIYSLNIDSSRQFLYPEIFNTDEEKNLTSEFVDNRKQYYERVKELAADQDGLFYVVGSDEFLRQNIATLRSEGIVPEQILLDKSEKTRAQFFDEDIAKQDALV